jgi:flagellar M-ring protein FliF
MQRTEQTAGAQSMASGIPGTASNAPNAQALPVYPQQTAPPQTAKSESGTYGASKTVRHVLENPGRVRRMTAAIVVNDRLAEAAAHGNAAVWKPRSADELRHLTALAQASVGFDATRGDMLTVEDLAFEENRAAQPASLPDQILATAEGSPVLVKYAALLIGLLIILAFAVRPALKAARTETGKQAKTAAKELPAGTEAVNHHVLNPAVAPELDLERIRVQEIFDQVSGQLKREPAQSSRLLQSWIHSD